MCVQIFRNLFIESGLINTNTELICNAPISPSQKTGIGDVTFVLRPTSWHLFSKQRPGTLETGFECLDTEESQDWTHSIIRNIYEYFYNGDLCC